jgi:hypothetical protein
VDRPASDLFADLQRFVECFGVHVLLEEMDIETPGKFDGLTITINPKHDQTAASYYLAHSFGSIVQWSTDFAGAQKVFDELHEAKKHREKAPEAFEEALAHYLAFEQGSSEHAAWMLAEIGHGASIDPYTVFFRADLESMEIFHRTGKAPAWPEFFGEWQRKVARGEIRPEPFSPRPCSRFTPVKIKKQKVLQER